MKLHLPVALLTAVLCVSTPVAHAWSYQNTKDYLRTEEKPTGIFEHSYNTTTGAVEIKLHEGDFSFFDMYFTAYGVTSSDNGVVMGASSLTNAGKYVSNNHADNTDTITSVTISIDGAHKAEGTYQGTFEGSKEGNSDPRRLIVSGIGYASCKVTPDANSEAAAISITMNSGDVTSIIGGVYYAYKSNDLASGSDLMAAKYTGDIDITVNGGTVGDIYGGHCGKEFDRIHNIIKIHGAATDRDKYGQVVSITDQEKYEELMANKHWSVGGDINIKVTDGKVNNIWGTGGDAHSVDGDVNIQITGGEITGNIVSGPTDAFAELGGSATVEVSGNAKVGGSIYSTNKFGTEVEEFADRNLELPAPCIKKDATIIISGNAVVEQDVYAAGDGGRVEGNTSVYLQDNATVKGTVSGTGINGASLGGTSTLYVGTEANAFTGSIGSYEGFSNVIIANGSSLVTSNSNVFATRNLTLTLSPANLNTAALIGTSAVVSEDGLAITLNSAAPLGSGKYKVIELKEGRARAAAIQPQGWNANAVTVNGIAGFEDLTWENGILYLILKEQNVDAAIASNWGVFKSSQAFTGTLWGNRSNAVVLNASPAIDEKGAPVSTTPADRNLAWAAAYAQSGRISDEGADYSLYGAALGIERQFGSVGSSIGAAFGYDWGKVDPFTTSNVDQETWHAALYGRVGAWNAGKGIVSVDWSAAYGETTSEHKELAGDWEQDYWQLDMRVTYARSLSDRLTGSVFAGAQYYSHDSAKVEDMEISSMKNLRLMIGSGLSYDVSKRTNLYGQISLYSDIKRDNPHVDVNGACFKGTNPGRTGGSISVGADYSITDQWDVRGGYSFDVAEDSTEHNVNIGVQHSF